MERALFYGLFLAIAFEGAFAQICPTGRGQTCWGNEEIRLIKDLFGSYDPIARPVKNVSQAVQVEFGLAIKSILDVDEQNGAVTLNLWKRAAWTDEFLAWDPAAYGGVEQISVPPERMWNPDILSYNGVSEVQAGKVLNVILKTGYVMNIVPIIYKAQCGVKNDTYTCSIKYGSWTQSKNQIELSTGYMFDPIDTTDYITAGPSCHLVKHAGEVVDKTYDGVPDIYQSLNVDLKIQCH